MAQLTPKAMAMEASRMDPELFSSPQLSFPTDTHRPSLPKSILTPPKPNSSVTSFCLTSHIHESRKGVSLPHLCTCSVTAQIDGYLCTVPRTQSLYHNQYIKSCEISDCQRS